MNANNENKTLVSCVIPCYKSSEIVGSVVEELKVAAAARPDYALEVILVNDGSPDGGKTAAKIKEIAAGNEGVVAVNLSRNFGQHAALMAGFARVRGSIVVCLDDDGQTPANETFKLTDKVLEGYDLVYASYEGNKKHNAFRNLGSKFNMWTDHHLSGAPKGIEITSFFACKRFVVDCALNYKNPYPYIRGLVHESIDTCANVPVKHRERKVGKSGYTLGKLIGLWSNGFTAFSIAPLRIATCIGTLIAFIGFVLMVVIIVQRILDPNIAEGWTSLMSMLLFVGGLIMLMLGMLGEYVGRIYLSINNIPQYVVRDVSDSRKQMKGTKNGKDIKIA